MIKNSLKFTLSPLMKRRLALYTASKRALIATYVFLSLFIVSLCSEFVANDRPLLVRYEGTFYTPFVSFYSEKTFGGDFETEANYKDPYVQDLIKAKGWIVWPINTYSFDTINLNVAGAVPAPPSSENWLGTDDQGRDVLARLVYGLRSSLLFSFGLTFLSVLIGVVMGSIQGYFGGKVDLILQRFTEIWGGLPILYILIIISSMMQPTVFSLMIIMALVNWIILVGVVRAEFLRTRTLDYVRAAQALGVSTSSIIFRHILPNALVAIITYVPFMLNSAIVTLTALDFLGFGLPVGAPSLGELISQGRNNTHAPWLGLTAFAVMSLLLSSLIFIGEAVRDAFDPKKTLINKDLLSKEPS